jgi:dolichol-phosphate mannosyltransferase
MVLTVNSQPTIYILFAAYNEEQVMPHFLANIKQEMEKIGVPYKVVACTDASTDSTASIIRAHKSEMPIELLEPINERGLGVAFRHSIDAICDIAEREDDIVIFLDADCTHDLYYSAKLMEEIAKGNDVVIASRFTPTSTISGFPLYRTAISMGASLFFRLLFPIKGVKDYTSGYRAYRVSILRKARAHYNKQLIAEKDFCCAPEMLIKLRHIGAKCAEIPFDYKYGLKLGESKMNIPRLIIATFKMSWHLLSLR